MLLRSLNTIFIASYISEATEADFNERVGRIPVTCAKHPNKTNTLSHVRTYYQCRSKAIVNNIECECLGTAVLVCLELRGAGYPRVFELKILVTVLC